MTESMDPAALRRRLRNELRRLRVESQLTQREVAQRLQWSASKIIRIESGAVAISRPDLRALLDVYAVRDEQVVAELLDIAQRSRHQSWSEYRDVLTPQTITYFGYESSASILRQFETLLVPGLLQSEEYIRALLSGGMGMPDTQAERLLEARLTRQEILERDTTSEMFFVLDETVVRRPIGGPAVMRRQLQRLLDLSERPGLSVQILPLAVGATAGLQGAFVCLEFPVEFDDGVVVVENSAGESAITEGGDQFGRYLDRFYDLERLALSQDQSREALRQVILEMSDGDAGPLPAPAPVMDELDQYFVL